MATSLACPSCATHLEPAQVLAACSVVIPGTELLRFRCPHCGADGLAMLSSGRLGLGAAAHDGGAGFHATTVTDAPDLFVRTDVGWLDCWHGGAYRRFPAAT